MGIGQMKACSWGARNCAASWQIYKYQKKQDPAANCNIGHEKNEKTKSHI